MDAELFCLNKHVEAAATMVRHLQRFVDPSVALRVMNTETAWPERDEIGRRYTKLLHASVPPERELTIEAVTGLELFGSRIYLRIYWPLAFDAVYRHPGGEMISPPYSITVERQFHVRNEGLEAFLPALAIRDRMVLVPRGQNETLDGLGPDATSLPPMQRGVIEVDFADSVQLEQAFVTVGHALRQELRNELLAYRSYHPSDQLDLDAVSAHLGVTPALLRRAVREEAEARELIYKQLRCRLEPTTIVKDVQTRLSLTIENPSAIDLGDLRVQMRGPSSGLEVYPERVPIEVPAEASMQVDFSVVATRAGEFVVEVLFLDADTDVPREMLPVQQLWITSVPS
jgi:hypothetical protein